MQYDLKRQFFYVKWLVDKLTFKVGYGKYDPAFPKNH